MKYSCPLLVIDLGRDPTSALLVMRQIAPAADTLTVVAYMPEHKLPWVAAEQQDAPALLEQLKARAADAAHEVSVNLALDLNAEDLSDLSRQSNIDLLVLSQPTLPILAAAAILRRRLALPLLLAGPEVDPGAPIEDLRSFAPLLARRARSAAVLVLPPSTAAPIELRRAIDVPDLVDEDGLLRARLLFAVGLGRHEPIPDQDVAFVGGNAVTIVRTHEGFAEIASKPGVDSVDLYRKAKGKSEQRVLVIRPGSRPLVLFDSKVDFLHLTRIRDADLLGVRMRPVRSCRAIRVALERSGLAAPIVDASAVLDEGPALDVGEDLDAVRLARVAARMRMAGFPVAAIVHGDPTTPLAIGFRALNADEITGTEDWAVGRTEISRSFAALVETATGATLIGGNRIEIELDNAMARRWLLEAIAGAKRRVHLQVYMALDDDVGSKIEAALAAAAERGVTVRVVVDSLHGLEGSFGAHNELLERLRARPGVELRLIDPITHAPSLEELKQRDHRKLVVVDGIVALLGGRNLSHEYYTGFDEVGLTSGSPWREVPWLDGGARVEGPAVAALERSFMDAWLGAGGAQFDIQSRPPAGSAAARVIVHHGLRDAFTLDTYVSLIDSATSHVNAVNGFPLILEIQHALLRAIRRGVRVRCLVGNLTPTHDGIPFKGPWGELRMAATELVHSRMDPIVSAGGEAFLFAVAQLPNWEAGLGTVHPHVHAKILTVDGRVSSVGSANLDVTAGYWENELVLIVEDESITRQLEARIDALIAASARVDRNDPQWRLTARRRIWFQRWPGVLSV